jgi:hypothetical protein
MMSDMHLIVRERTVAFAKPLEAIQAMQKQIGRWDSSDRRIGERRQSSSGLT